MRYLVCLALLAVACGSPVAPEPERVLAPANAVAELTVDEFNECQRQFRESHLYYLPQIRYAQFVACLARETAD